MTAALKVDFETVLARLRAGQSVTCEHDTYEAARRQLHESWAEQYKGAIRHVVAGPSSEDDPL